MPELSPEPAPSRNWGHWLFVGIGIVVLWVVVAVALVGYTGRQGLRTSNIKACGQAKEDRKDIAESLTAHKLYIEKVVLAQSVKEDVKIAARKANTTHERTAHRLTQRAKINCIKENPKASLLP